MIRALQSNRPHPPPIQAVLPLELGLNGNPNLHHSGSVACASATLARARVCVSSVPRCPWRLGTLARGWRLSARPFLPPSPCKSSSFFFLLPLIDGALCTGPGPGCQGH